MPFQSEKQRRFLHANHPEIAKRWERDYAHGGILDINESEEIISDDGNEIALTDYNAAFDDPNDLSTGVKSLFQAKEGGTPRRRYFTGAYGGGGDKSSSSGPGPGGQGARGQATQNPGVSSTGGGYQNVHQTGAVSQTPYYDPTVPPQLGGEGTVTDAIDLARTDFERTKAKLEKKIRNAGIWKIVGAVLSGGLTLGLSDLKTAKTMYDLAQVEKNYIKLLENAKTQYKDVTRNAHVDTAIQTLDQEILDLTQRPDKDEDRGGDGGPEPILNPVTLEVGTEYAQGDYGISDLDRIRAGQAKRAMINPDWQNTENILVANSGGLANLFRVKKQ